MKIFKGIPSIIADIKNNDALSYDLFVMVSKFKKAIKYLQQHGMFLTFVPSSPDENPLVRVIYIILLIIVIILFIFFMFVK